MSIFNEGIKRNQGEAVRKEDSSKNNLVKVEWSVGDTCEEYYTVWVTYTIGNKSVRKRSRLYKSDFRALYFTDRDFWCVLRYTIGDTIEHFRERGKITMNSLKTIMQETDNFYNDDWGHWLHEISWLNHYGHLDNDTITDFVSKVICEYEEENSQLVGWF